MKNICFIFLFSLFYSCNKENNDENVMGDPFKIDVEFCSELQNQITNISPIAYLNNGSRFVIGRSYKTQNGFELHLQNPLNPIFLYPLKQYFLHGEIDNDVMCYGAVYLYAHKGDKFVGPLIKSSHYNNLENRDEISYSLHLMYVTGDATVSGNSIIDGKPFRLHNVRFKQGWNLYMCIQTIHYTIEGSLDSYCEFTSEIPDNLVWKLLFNMSPTEATKI